NNGMYDLGTLGGSSSEARAVNDSGQVAGFSQLRGNVAEHAFLYDGTAMLDLGTLGGPSSPAFGMNSSGLVVGYAVTAGRDVHAFVSDGTTMQDLGTLGGNESQAFSINSAGQVAGLSTVASGVWHASSTTAWPCKTLAPSAAKAALPGRSTTPAR